MAATRYEGIIHDFVVLSARRGTQAAGAAINQAIEVVRKALTLAGACRRRAGTPAGAG